MLPHTSKEHSTAGSAEGAPQFWHTHTQYADTHSLHPPDKQTHKLPTACCAVGAAAQQQPRPDDSLMTANTHARTRA